MAKSDTSIKTKTIAINLFFIENPSFRLDLSDFTYIDGRDGEFIHRAGEESKLKTEVRGASRLAGLEVGGKFLNPQTLTLKP
jgi:hypothetical protein